MYCHFLDPDKNLIFSNLIQELSINNQRNIEDFDALFPDNYQKMI